MRFRKKSNDDIMDELRQKDIGNLYQCAKFMLKTGFKSVASNLNLGEL